MARRAAKAVTRKLDALPDTVDFRDVIFVPTLIRVLPETDLKAYRALKIPVLDQGTEGACTGFGLADRCKLPFFGQAGKMPRRRRRSAPGCCTQWQSVTTSGQAKTMTAQARGAMKGWFNMDCAPTHCGTSVRQT